MITDPTRDPPTGPTKSRWGRCLIVLIGILAGQAILYGPSLIGAKILLPLDILEGRGVYLPSDMGEITVENPYLSDLVYVFERGLLLPRGTFITEFFYRPASFARGVALAVSAGVTLLAWVAIEIRTARERTQAVRGT